MTKKVTITTLRRMEQEQKDYENCLEEMQELTELRNYAITAPAIFGDKKLRIAAKLGDLRKVYEKIAEERWGNGRKSI